MLQPDNGMIGKKQQVALVLNDANTPYVTTNRVVRDVHSWFIFFETPDIYKTFSVRWQQH